MKSVYQYLGIPDVVSGGFVVLCLILLLSPYAAGSDWGIFKIPDFPKAKRILKWVGPILLVLAIVGFFPFISTQSQGGNGTTTEANTIEWSKINDDNDLIREIGDSYRIYLELHSGIVRDSRGVPRCYVYFGKSNPYGTDSNDIFLRIQPKPLGEKTPSLMAFVVRDLNDYHQLVDIDSTTGMPQQTKATKLEKTWTIANYKKGERLKIVLFVIPDSDEGLRELNLAKVEDIIDANIRKK